MPTLEQKQEYYRSIRERNYKDSCRLEGMKVEQIKVELLDYMGSDLAVVDAARVSFNKTSDWEYLEPVDGWKDSDELFEKAKVLCQSKGRKFQRSINGNDQPKVLSVSDEKLINFLATHDHWTPFAHTALKFRVAAPVPIRTQC